MTQRRTRIKICGLRDEASVRAAVEAGADAVGFVFVHGSPRHIHLEQARPLVAALPAFVEPVGLFVDAALGEVRQAAAELGLRTVQLHGSETPEFAAALSPLRVIKGLHFTPDAASHAAVAWCGVANVAALLWDTPPRQPQAAAAGGSGVRFDWEGLAALVRRGVFDRLPPIVVAGGLNPDNVPEAIAAVRPFAVDVSSGVESSRGVKDAALIARFCAAVRQADQ
jgi:phosphoribosylanthranilate isomerase